MAHELSETLEGTERTRYEYRTAKLGHALRSTVYEWNNDGNGFWYWLPFGGWSVTLANSSNRATAKAVASQHAAYRLAARAAVAERLAHLAATAAVAL